MADAAKSPPTAPAAPSGNDSAAAPAAKESAGATLIKAVSLRVLIDRSVKLLPNFMTGGTCRCRIGNSDCKRPERQDCRRSEKHRKGSKSGSCA
jgi:hypothetical protein